MVEYTSEYTESSADTSLDLLLVPPLPSGCCGGHRNRLEDMAEALEGAVEPYPELEGVATLEGVAPAAVLVL